MLIDASPPVSNTKKRGGRQIKMGHFIKENITVVLSTAANGDILPIMPILKFGSNPRKEDGTALKEMKKNKVVYWTNSPKGFMKKELWEDFFNKIMLPRVMESVRKQEHVLILYDSSTTHDMSFTSKWTAE